MAGTPVSSVRAGLPLGLTGATAATRYVGATASGAPASGTFEVGDFCIDQSGAIYVCTAAGTPGTWAAVAGGGGYTELAHVAFTAPVAITASTEATATEIVSAGAVVFDGAQVVVIEFYCNDYAAGSAGNIATVVLYDGAGSIGQLSEHRVHASSNGINGPVYVARRLTPSAASHTYSIRAYSNVAGGNTLTFYAGAGGSGNRVPGFIRITQVS